MTPKAHEMTQNHSRVSCSHITSLAASEAEALGEAYTQLSTCQSNRQNQALSSKFDLWWPEANKKLCNKMKLDMSLFMFTHCHGHSCILHV